MHKKCKVGSCVWEYFSRPRQFHTCHAGEGIHRKETLTYLDGVYPLGSVRRLGQFSVQFSVPGLKKGSTLSWHHASIAADLRQVVSKKIFFFKLVGRFTYSTIEISLTYVYIKICCYVVWGWCRRCGRCTWWTGACGNNSSLPHETSSIVNISEEFPRGISCDSSHWSGDKWSVIKCSRFVRKYFLNFHGPI